MLQFWLGRYSVRPFNAVKAPATSLYLSSKWIVASLVPKPHCDHQQIIQ